MDKVKLTFHPQFGYRCSACNWSKETYRNNLSRTESKDLDRQHTLHSQAEREFLEHVRSAHLIRTAS